MGDIKEREELVKKLAVTLSTLSVGFGPNEFLTALALTAAAVINKRYERKDQIRAINGMSKSTKGFLKAWHEGNQK
jgi:hypothetical protein